VTIRITFSETDAGSGTYKTEFNVGDTFVPAPPQSIPSIYRDLVANSLFLSEKRLSSFFWSEEPIFNIRYHDDRIEAYLFRQSDLGIVEVCSAALLDSTVSYLSGLKDAFSAVLGIVGASKDDLEAQVQRDIALSVYDVYLQNSD
jgi:hypothetical protein